MPDLMNRIILGTANFVKPYNGVKVNDTDAILQYCKDSGVWAIDTATAYDTHNLEYPKKIVKVQKDDVLFGKPPMVVMSHNMDAYERAISISNAKNTFLGASIYIDDIDRINTYVTKPRCIQFPYSVLDRRFESYLPVIKLNGVQIHARSIFCGGEVLKKTLPFNALMFVLANQYIDKVVVGTESLGMLQDTLEPLREMDSLKCEDKAIIELRKDSK